MPGSFGSYGKSWRGMDETGSASRVIAAMLAVVFVLVAMGLPSFASHGTDGFEIDGDLDVDGLASTADDWANHTPTAVLDLTAPDNIYNGAVRPDDDPDTFTLTDSTGGPDKADLTKYNLFLQNISSQDWLFLMWERSSSNGDANVDFEFNQAATSANSTTLSGLPPRTPGDKLITYDFTNGGGANAQLFLLTWLSASPTTECERSPQSNPGPCWGNRTALNGTNHAVVNDATVQDGSESLTAGQFGEAAINLTSLTGLNTCLRANQVYVHTRSSSSFSSAILKDVILPQPISFNNCPTLGGTKYHDDEADADVTGDSGLQGWTINAYKEKGTANGDLSQAEYDDGPAATTTTDANGTYSMTLDFGNYVICEELQANWFQSIPASTANGECNGIDTDTNPALGNEGHAVTFTAATNSNTNHFGNYQNSSISGTKFEDDDGAGSGTTGDPLGSPTFTINLYKDADRNGSLSGTDELTRVAFADTSGSGQYSFTGLTPGKYVVCEEPDTSWTQSTPSNSVCSATNDEDGGHAVTLLSQSPSNNNDFGNFTLGSISGTKWEDGMADGLDPSGTLTPNDAAPSSQFKIYLYKGSSTDTQPDNWPQETTTDQTTGAYSFANLEPGTYTVCEEDKANWTQSAPTSGCSGTGIEAGGYSVTLDSGESETGKDFANYRPGEISGTKWNDLDNDGIDTSDTALLDPVHTIKLYTDTNKDGNLDDGEPEADSTTTSATDGTYKFENVAPGHYIVCEVGVTGWTQTAPGDTKCAAATTGNDKDDKGYSVIVTSGDTTSSAVTNRDFANFQIPAGSISGWKYEDLNGDGNFDTGEPVVEGWAVTLFKDADNSGTINGTEALTPTNTTTGTSTSGTPGLYVFTGLTPGQYIVCENAQSSTSTGWFQSGPTTVPNCTGAGFAAKGHLVTLATHTSVSANNDFFNYRGSSISGTKFEDDDGAGSGTTGSTLTSPSFTINLYFDANGNGTLAGTELTTPFATRTTSSGTYSFTGLAPGKYLVCEAPKASWTQSAPTGNDCLGTGDSNGGHPVTLTSDTHLTGKDFSNWTSATISGKKVEDGLNDGLDTGGANNDTVPGTRFKITLYVDADNDDAIDNPQPANWPKDTLTNATTGAYSFTVDPGSYIVCEDEEASWTQSAPSNSTCSSVTAHEDGGYGPTVTSGGSSSDNDFANYRLGSISGKKWSDLDNNGKDAGDVTSTTQFTIKLYEDKNADGDLDTTPDEMTPLQTDTTDATTGEYEFTGLTPGHYLVCEEGVAGWTQTTPSGTECAAATTANTGDNGGHAVELSSGTDEDDKDFANFELPAGSISGHKYHDLDGDGTLDSGEPPIQGWTVSLYEDLDDDGALDLDLIDPTKDETTPADTDTTDATGAFMFTNVPAGNYLVCEDEQKSTSDTGWIQSAPSGPGDCSSLDSNADDGFDVTQATQRSTSSGNDFMNYKTATIHVVKTTDPANADQSFGFSGPAQDTGTINPATTPNDRLTRSDLEPGSYIWTEAVVGGWTLESVICSDSATGGKASTTDLTTRSATFKVESGDEVTCTFHNTKDAPPPPPPPPPPPSPTPTPTPTPAEPGTIVVTKQTLPDGSDETFEFAGALSGSLSDGQSLSAEVDAGSYTVAEAATDGWELSEISCTDSDPEGTASTVSLQQRSATLNVDEGETVECTFTNLENEVLPKPPVKSPEPEPEVLPKKVKTGVLPFTGTDPYRLLLLAGLLITSGGGLVLVRRRRRS